MVIKWFKKLLGFIKRQYPSFDAYRANENTAIKDWVEAIDALIVLIQSARVQLDPSRLDHFDIDVFEINSYLYQVDRLAVKTREYIMGLRYHQTQFESQPEVLKRKEFANVYQACLSCYPIILNLIVLLQTLSKTGTLKREFFLQVQSLEIECSALRNTVRELNQFLTEIQSKSKMVLLEQTLLRALEEAEVSLNKQNDNMSRYLVVEASPTYQSSEKLKNGLGNIAQIEDQKLMVALIDAYDALRKCYVIARKSVVKETLDAIYIAVQELMVEFSKDDINKERLMFYLYILFNQIESLRFSTNRDSRCSRNLFEKSKHARRQLRKACFAHPLGKEFIEKIALRRKSLLKDYKQSN